MFLLIQFILNRHESKGARRNPQAGKEDDIFCTEVVIMFREKYYFLSFKIEKIEKFSISLNFRISAMVKPNWEECSIIIRYISLSRLIEIANKSNQ